MGLLSDIRTFQARAAPWRRPYAHLFVSAAHPWHAAARLCLPIATGNGRYPERREPSIENRLMTDTSKMRANAAFAAFTGLTLRLFFVLRFPMTVSGDGPFYIELAWNWLKYGVYGL